MKNLIRIEIWGREYTVRSDEGEERVKNIAAYVNQKIKEISEGRQTVSTLNVAILAALNIANDYFEAVEHQKTLSQDIESRSGRLIDVINSKIE